MVGLLSHRAHHSYASDRQSESLLASHCFKIGVSILHRIITSLLHFSFVSCITSAIAGQNLMNVHTRAKKTLQIPYIASKKLSQSPKSYNQMSPDSKTE